MSVGATFSVNVNVNFSVLDRKFSEASLKKGELAMANQAMMDMEQFVPMRSGRLRSGAHAKPGEVIYPGPYGRAHFYGTNGIVVFRKYTTPGTGKRWDKRVPKGTVREWGVVAIKAMGIQ
ncbi:capsid protein [Atopobacter sp. AH10]|uniref:minor capsid protein n=1 Tax=Atopobacter sp. AH10 TaxID=2315861 RepID=UPI000EF18983|nr:minor capsid protein [Atopobacter sp. AH10]RLK63155.1 capsid protein [Atopobacter sp. AH10]